MEQGKASILRDCARVEPQREISRLAPCCLLTVKLRGRTMRQAAPQSNEALQAYPMRTSGRRGRTISYSARGAKQTTHHGPLERLLEVTLTTTTVRVPPGRRK